MGNHTSDDVRRRTIAFARRFTELTGSQMPLRLWDGTEIGDGTYRLVLDHPGALRRMLVPPTDLNVGEAYIFGDIDLEGDIVAALHAIARLRTALTTVDQLRLAAGLIRLPAPRRNATLRERAARLSGSRHSRDRDRHAVRFHYDLGNDFFRCFLDEGLVYSCAYFEDPDTTLEHAQQRKLDLVARKLQLKPGDRVLDVGCGWGSFVLHAACEYGARAVGVTLSTQQAETARERVRRAGVDDLVEIRIQDYREVTGSFDAIASIGMVEHVGSDHLDDYFGHLRGLLRPGGRLLNHGITTGLRRIRHDLDAHDRSFVSRYVFPDGGLVPASAMVTAVEDAGFEVHDLHQLRPNYALTLREWVRRLEANHDRAVDAASEVDYRIWRAYMAGSVVGFETNDLGVVQVLAGKGADVPLDRSFMAPSAFAPAASGAAPDDGATDPGRCSTRSSR